MIVPRKYEWLGALYENDPDSRLVIEKAFELTNLPPEKKGYLIDYNHFNIPAFMNLGCGIPGQTYVSFMRGFELLDKSMPYDNGLTFNDVSRVEFETSRKGTAIQMRFVSEVYDLPYRIVGFAAIDNNGGKMRINKGWDMCAPFELG